MSRTRCPAIVLCGLVLGFLALPACGPSLKQEPVETELTKQEKRVQRELAMRLECERADRLAAVAFRLRQAAIGVCSEEARTLGLKVHDLASYEKEERQAAIDVFHVGNAVQVRRVDPGSPAEQCGLACGDTIVQMGGRRVAKALDAQERLEELVKSSADGVLMTVLHGGERSLVFVPFARVLSYPVFVMSGDQINAYANGRSVWVTEGLMRFAASDVDLAIIVGHELAHNALKHLKKAEDNRQIGSLFDGLFEGITGIKTGDLFADIGEGMFSQAFELEADYLGLYLARRAGYDITHAAVLWRRLAAEKPSSIKGGGTHPGTGERYLAMENAIAEIERKVAAGQPLVPERR